ncbi:uncharacterized protein LOC133923526 [Phragmites australis]|uniref:uncharacterized protein LOC133923526 n=1 Tax=Phragmites australis TaxID=29695 RepID=UPI002D796C71|nr:uncharacterized protein LOC133923526 [Phragmites australis]
MASLWEQPSLEFGVKVVRAAGLEAADQRQLEEGGTLFVRYYVPAGDGRRRLRVDTREVPRGGGDAGDAFWGELARFERWGAGAPGGGVVFELRWRPRPSSGLAALLGAGNRRRPSRVLARAELAWRDVSLPPAERWLTLSPASRELAGCKAPKLLVEVETIHSVASEVAERKSGGTRDCCSAGECCGQCGWIGNEEDMFLAATFSQQL